MIMRVSKEEQHDGMITIDITGPQGNAFFILGFARNLGNEIYGWQQTDQILDEMRSSTYETLLDIFEENFGDYVIILE